MPKRHAESEKDQDTPGSDRESGATAKRPGWRAGHLPRMPRAEGEEPDWVTGMLQERALDGLFEDQAGDHDHPGRGA